MSLVRSVAAAAATLAALAAGAQPASADTGRPVGPTVLTLSVAATRDPAPRSVTLRCDPAGGGHPHARQACDALAVAGGGFGRLPGTRQMCPMIYAPVTATAQGVWRGIPVRWSQRFANACLLGERTGALFRF